MADGVLDIKLQAMRHLNQNVEGCAQRGDAERHTEQTDARLHEVGGGAKGERSTCDIVSASAGEMSTLMARRNVEASAIRRPLELETTSSSSLAGEQAALAR